MIHLLNLFLSGLQLVCRSILIKTFWAWFILTQFQGLPTIGYVGAIGFSMFVAAMTPFRSATMKEWDERLDGDSGDQVKLSILNSAAYILGSLIVLGVGWIVHQCM